MLTQLIETPELWKVVNPSADTRPSDKELDESIRYAKRIQDGMMLKEKHLQRIFPESFLYLKPRNTVTGDFYWFTKLENKVIIAAADCTGHGIPGALMSILGISLLNQIVIEEKNTDPSFILQRLDHKVRKAFSYTLDSHEVDTHNDGMDISLCCVDYKSGTIQFAGAYNSLYHVRRKRLTELKGSRYPIGGINIGKEKLFETERMKIELGDKIYMCSDGFASQFGYFADKKYTSSRLKDLLVTTSGLPFSRQKTELDKNFFNWKLHNEQTDDVLVVGFKV